MNGGISMTLPSISEEDDEDDISEEEQEEEADESEASRPLQRPPTPPSGNGSLTRNQNLTRDVATSPAADFGTFLKYAPEQNVVLSPHFSIALKKIHL